MNKAVRIDAQRAFGYGSAALCTPCEHFFLFPQLLNGLSTFKIRKASHGGHGSSGDKKV
jgi:hypothetical protein